MDIGQSKKIILKKKLTFTIKAEHDWGEPLKSICRWNPLVEGGEQLDR